MPCAPRQARTSLALVLLQVGDPDGALHQLDLAFKLAPAAIGGTVLQQRALVLVRLGRLDEALQASREALVRLRRAGDRLTEARVLTNRGVLHAYRGELGLATADLHKALELYRALDGGFAAAQVLHNLGYVAVLAGDVPEALRLYDEAAEAFRGLEVPLARLHVDRAELLLSACLLPEARREAELGVEALARDRNKIDLAEARLLLAQVALAELDLETASAEARDARREFHRHGRHRWAAQASFVEAQAKWASGTTPRRIIDEAGALAARLEAEGWIFPGLECRVIGARAALDAGRNEDARRLLDGVDPRTRNGPAAQRVRSWLGEALARVAAGNRKGALAALRTGLEIAEEYRATLGATELRVRTATTVGELADFGLGLAFESGRATEVFRWSERWRAGTLRATRVTPPSDTQLAAALVTLRDTVARLEQATLAGEDTAPFLERQRRIEGEIRRRSRVASGGFASAPPLVRPDEVRAAVGDRALVEFIEYRGGLHAVVITAKGFRLHSLGSAAEVARDRASLQFALSRLALRRSHAASLEAGAMLLERSCSRLSDQLIGPLAGEVDGRDLVIVPTGELHALPWAMLPGLRGRPMTVAPSASLWLSRAAAANGNGARARAASRSTGVVLVAGPRVAGGAEEVRSLHRSHYGDATVLDGAAATAVDVARALEGRSLAHIAAHGTFRADNAQFSSLELADGPLTVYDLERMRRPPRLDRALRVRRGPVGGASRERAHGDERRAALARHPGDRLQRGARARRRGDPGHAFAALPPRQGPGTRRCARAGAVGGLARRARAHRPCRRLQRSADGPRGGRLPVPGGRLRARRRSGSCRCAPIQC